MVGTFSTSFTHALTHQPLDEPNSAPLYLPSGSLPRRHRPRHLNNGCSPSPVGEEQGTAESTPRGNVVTHNEAVEAELLQEAI